MAKRKIVWSSKAKLDLFQILEYFLILPFLRQLTYKVKLDFFSGQLAGKEI